MAQKNVCGQCEKEFANEAGYLTHVCSKTGSVPTSIDNLGPEFAAISEAALKRGEDRVGEKIHPSAKLNAK